MKTDTLDITSGEKEAAAVSPPVAAAKPFEKKTPLTAAQRIRGFVVKIFLVLTAVPCVMILRLLRPLVTIRLGSLDISRIGGLYKADWYLSERSAGAHEGRNLDVFYFVTINNAVCNRQWLKMWKRVLHTVPFGRLFQMIMKISERFPGHEAHVLPMDHVKTVVTEQRDKLRNILSCRTPHIAFTKEEESVGERALASLGLPKEKPFICFHSRDAAYLNTMYPGMTWSYHDYRDSAIGNFVPAAKELTQRGYSAVRMGAIVQEKLDGVHPGVIDYASGGQRSDFMDIYLGAKCRFFICSDSGISIVPEIFRRPAVYTNWTSVKRISPWILDGLVIFKKFYSHKENRLLTFPEIMDLEFGSPETEGFFKEQRIELVENTPEEITDAALEMEDRLKGTWQESPEDEQLQGRFWDLIGKDRLKSPDLRIGAKFLRQNQHLVQ